MTKIPDLLTFHTQTGRQNGGTGHILFRGTRIHLTMISENRNSYAEFPSLKTEQELRGCAKTMQDVVSGLNATLDVANIPNLEKYRIHTNLFNFTLPQNNILNLTSQTTQSVADGNWLP